MNSTNSAAAAVAIIVWLVVVAGLYVWTALALAAVFRKSGEEGWKAWVPLYNQAVLFRLGGLSPLLLLLYLAPGLGAVAVWVLQVIACHRINAAFALGPGMTVVAALLFPVWASILGFGSSRWVGEESGPRRTGLTGPGRTPSPSPSASRLTSHAPPSDAPPPFHGRSTHVAAPDPLFATSTDAVAPPAPAPGRPTPFAPTAAPPSTEGPVPPRTARSQSPVPPPPGGWAPPETAPERTPSTVLPFAPTAPSSGAGIPASPATTGSRPSGPSSDPFSPAPLHDAVDWSDAGDATLRRRGMFEPPVTATPISEDSEEVTGAVPGAPAPLSALPGTSSGEPTTPTPARSPEAETPARRRAPYGETGQPAVTRPPEPWAPSRSPLPESEGFADTSGPVSAIAGAPDAGSPRSALSSVSAQTRRPQIPDDPLDETVIARRRRTDWSIVPPEGGPIAIGSDVVLLGRRPAPDPARPGAQLISIDDGTVSKTHARLELRGEKWFVTDLDSTNGVVFATLMGTEVEATPGVEIEAGDRFLLGDAEIRLVRRPE